MSRLHLAICLMSMLLAGAAGWHVQAWRLGRQMAVEQALQAQRQAQQAAMLNQRLLAERDLRQRLEQRVQSSESRHFQELADAQQIQGRLRDRLATADLRLSVLVERDAACAGVPAAAGSGSVDHGPLRARLDPAHARRIIAITDEGDRGLIALRACQAHLRALAP